MIQGVCIEHDNKSFTGLEHCIDLCLVWGRADQCYRRQELGQPDTVWNTFDYPDQRITDWRYDRVLKAKNTPRLLVSWPPPLPSQGAVPPFHMPSPPWSFSFPRP